MAQHRIRKIHLGPLGVLLALLLLWTSAASAADRPNILIILADDLGYGDLSSYGGKDIRTPHVD